MVGHQTLNLAIGVRVPASQPLIPSSHLTTTTIPVQVVTSKDSDTPNFEFYCSSLRLPQRKAQKELGSEPPLKHARSCFLKNLGDNK